VIRGGRLVDGTGAPWFRADLWTVGDPIAAIEASLSADAHVSVSAEGSVVAPGFVDFHSHAEVSTGSVSLDFDSLTHNAPRSRSEQRWHPSR